MENLHNYLPMDLVNIVEEYSKDRTNYDKVINDLEILVNETIGLRCDEESEYCDEPGWYYQCQCESLNTKDLRAYPGCYTKHMNQLDQLIKNNLWVKYVLNT